MDTINILGEDVEFACTAYTTTIYEQAFRDDPYDKVTGDLVADIMRVAKIKSDEFVGVDEDGNLTISIDYTIDNWQAEKRALWAMIRTAQEIAVVNGGRRTRTLSYQEWDRSLVTWEPDLRELSLKVCNELQRGLFRAGAAASE